MRKVFFVGIVLILTFIAIASSNATPPQPNTSADLPPNKFLKENLGRLVYKRAFLPLVANVLRNRMAIQGGVGLLPAFEEMPSAAPSMGPTLVSGIKEVPVLLVKFRNTTGDINNHSLYQREVLQKRLFDGQPGAAVYTMTTFYKETSYGAFAVKGTVSDWVTASKDDSYYEGDEFTENGKKQQCNSLCPTGHLAELLQEVLNKSSHIDWGVYDNDGPDGKPNSGDDDGFVDFVAIVHSEAGAECRKPWAEKNIWSHRYNISTLAGQEYTTTSPKHGGGSIKIDDYTIQPGYSCDGHSTVDIGVFAHEFGHAFGLPDLYDTKQPPVGEGVGNWCLMGGGAWGGDGKSSDRPVQMSVWAKEFLGWITPNEIAFDQNVTIPAIEDHPVAYRIRVSSNIYYLVANVRKKLSDQNLPGEGLQIWMINESVMRAGLRTNRVNADSNNKGVDLVEADGKNQLDKLGYRGEATDLFGSPNQKTFDASTTPKAVGKVAICEISSPSESMTAEIRVSKNTCHQ